MHKHLSLFFRLSAAVLVLFFAFPQGIFAAEIRNPLNKAVWYKYGVNPYSTDTDNDGFSDVWEIQQNYCPTYPGIIALSDEQCQKGSFNLVRQTYVAPKGVSFYPSRSMTKVPSCQAFEALLARDTTGFQSLDVVSAGVGMYGADDPSLMVQEGSNVIVLSGQTVRIIDTKTTPERVTTLTISNESGFRPDRLYVRSSTVMIVGSVVSSTASHKEIVRTELWDIQDNSRPRRVRSVDVSGSLLGTYRTSDMVYMAMSPEGYRNDEAVRGGAYSQFKVPRLMEGIWLYRDARSQFQKIDALSWKTLAGCTSLEYAAPLWGKGMIHIVGFSLKNPQAALITKGLFGLSTGSALHFSGAYAFVTTPNFAYSWLGKTAMERTEIQRFTLSPTKIQWSGGQTVPGTIVADGLNIYQDKIRIATTLRTSPLTSVQNSYRNNIYVLDGYLTRLVWLEEFAPYEKMTAITFAGPMMYVRTDAVNQGLIVLGHGEYFTPKVLERVVPAESLSIYPLSRTHALTLGTNERVMSVAESLATTSPSSTIAQGLRTVSSTSYAGFHGVRVGLVSSQGAMFGDRALVIGDEGSYAPLMNNDRMVAYDTQRGYVALPVVTIVSTTAREAKNPSIEIIRPSEPGFVSGMSVYIIAPTTGGIPVVVGRIDIPRSGSLFAPQAVLGLIVRNQSLYIALNDGLMVVDMGRLALERTVSW